MNHQLVVIDNSTENADMLPKIKWLCLKMLPSILIASFIFFLDVEANNKGKTSSEIEKIMQRIFDNSIISSPSFLKLHRFFRVFCNKMFLH